MSDDESAVHHTLVPGGESMQPARAIIVGQRPNLRQPGAERSAAPGMTSSLKSKAAPRRPYFGCAALYEFNVAWAWPW